MSQRFGDLFSRTIVFRGVINGVAGKEAALPKFSDMLTLSQEGGGAETADNTPNHWLKAF
jgi:hypothetical protein